MTDECCYIGLSCEPAYNDKYASLNNRINALHEFKLRQCDENRENNKNVDSLISINKSLLERIERLEKLDKCNTDIFSTHMNKFDKLEKEIKQQDSFNHLANLADEGFIEAFNKLDKTIEGHQKQINDVIGLFTKGDSVLENDIINLIDNDKSLRQRIEKLEKTLENVVNISETVKRAVTHLQDNDGRKPHKCPVCDGFGKREWLLPDGRKIDHSICVPCQGKGIIWG